MQTTDLDHPAIAAALSTAATLLGMEVVFIGGMSVDTLTLLRVHGEMDGVAEGATIRRADSLCARLLAGAPASTADAPSDALYGDAPALSSFGIRSYVGVPIRDADGDVVGTLCGIDSRGIAVDDAKLAVLTDLAEIVAAHLTTDTGTAVIRRTPDGWRVGGEPAGDLTSAMVLADLLAGDVGAPARPPRPEAPLDEVEQLRLSVTQLEHALAARVLVEQAIGVLAERQHMPPRAAFERLRRAARTRGRRVHDLAREVVSSASDRGVPLPPELAGRR